MILVVIDDTGGAGEDEDDVAVREGRGEERSRP